MKKENRTSDYSAVAIITILFTVLLISIFLNTTFPKSEIDENGNMTVRLKNDFMVDHLDIQVFKVNTETLNTNVSYFSSYLNPTKAGNATYLGFHYQEKEGDNSVLIIRNVDMQAISGFFDNDFPCKVTFGTVTAILKIQYYLLFSAIYIIIILFIVPNLYSWFKKKF